MDLTWYGLSCFRLRERNYAHIVTDPFNGKTGLPTPKLKADVVTVSHDAPGHNHVKAVSDYQFALTGPGEYEIGSVFITGVVTSNKADDARNMLYVFDYDSITIAHLGDMRQVPTQAQMESLGEVNILLVPVGGGNSLNAAQAAEVVSMLEPNIVVPMHYAVPGLKFELAGVDRFLNQMGVTEPTEESMLRISASRLPEETEVVVLAPKG